MRPPWPPVAVLSAAAVVALGLATAGNAAVPRPPSLPPGGKKAVFRVLVEGTGSATHKVAGTGTNGACDISTNTETEEGYDYARGKNFEVVFIQFARRAPPLMKRVGRRSLLTEFHVRGSFSDYATGEASRSGDRNACVPVTETVGDEAGCGQYRGGLDMALEFVNGRLSVDLGHEELPRLPGGGCGSNSVESVSGYPLLGWRGFPRVKPERIPTRLIYGHGRGFVVNLSSGEVRQVTESPIPGFPIDVVDTGTHDVTVRFIRVRPGH